MGNTSSRTLRLLSLFQTQRYWPGADLAERLGVSIRTLRRDVLDWPALALGAVGAEFDVLHPPELLDHLREWAGRFQRAKSP
jgi:predicted DNA-binding transcriptional regulator YafY